MNRQPVSLEPEVNAIQNPITTIHDFGDIVVWGGTGPAVIPWSSDMTVSSELSNDQPQLDGYFGARSPDVVAYVQMHIPLEEALRRAKQLIQQHFGIADVSLEIKRLPSDDWEPRLIVKIHTPQKIDDALDNLDKFDMSFWGQEPGMVDKCLRVSLE